VAGKLERRLELVDDALATTTAASASAMSGRSTANSSPPSWARVSPSRKPGDQPLGNLAEELVAGVVTLITLKRSRSTKSRPTVRLVGRRAVGSDGPASRHLPGQPRRSRRLDSQGIGI
jgi:hypothetical protein